MAPVAPWAAVSRTLRPLSLTTGTSARHRFLVFYDASRLICAAVLSYYCPQTRQIFAARAQLGVLTAGFIGLQNNNTTETVLYS